MALKAFSLPIIQASAFRLYSSRAPAAVAAQNEAARKHQLPTEPPKLTSLPSGVVVASQENNNPISRVSVVFKAGSRYESYLNQGVAHCLRNAAGLSCKNATIFGITRNLQLMGANLTATGTRELLIYTLECNRDNVKDAMKYLNQVTCGQVFKPWEIRDFKPRMDVEVAFLHQRPNIMVLESLHKAAFRTGLGNYLYSPNYMLGRHDTAMLNAFTMANLALNRMAVVGIGLTHEAAMECANSLRLETIGSTSDIPSKYAAGEIRIEKVMPYSHVAIATSGISLKDPKEVLASGVLQQILGTYPLVKRAIPPNKLNLAASKATQNPFAVSCININYSDAGLFGFYVAGWAEDMSKIVKSLVEAMAAIKNGVADPDVQVGKHRLKAAIHMASESATGLAEEFGSQALHLGKLISAAEIDSTIDSISAADVNAVAKKISTSKPSMAAVGNLIDTPYLDQIR